MLYNLFRNVGDMTHAMLFAVLLSVIKYNFIKGIIIVLKNPQHTNIYSC